MGRAHTRAMLHCIIVSIVERDRAAEIKEKREVRLCKRRETDRARRDQEETRAMETDDEREVRLERQRQTEGDKRCRDY